MADNDKDEETWNGNAYDSSRGHDLVSRNLACMECDNRVLEECETSLVDDAFLIALGKTKINDQVFWLRDMSGEN